MPVRKQQGGGSMERGIMLLLTLAQGPLTPEQLYDKMSEYYNPSVSLDGARRMRDRDLEVLRELGFSVAFHDQHYFLEKGPTSFYRFRQEDIDVLVLLHTLFSDPRSYLPDWAKRKEYPAPRPVHPFAPGVVNMIERLAEELPDEQRRQFEQQTKRPFVFLNIHLAVSYQRYHSIIDFFVQAIQLRRQVSFLYLSREEDAPREYCAVNPHFIEAKEEQLYLVASMEDGERLFFRLDRFVPKSLILLPSASTSLRAPRLTTIRFWIRRGLLAANRQSDQLRVSDRWQAQTIVAEAYNRQRVLVEVETDDLFRARKYFLSLGNQATVISPASFVNELQEEIKQMATDYQVLPGEDQTKLPQEKTQ